MNQLFSNVAGAIVHQIRREKLTTISEVIVRSKRNIKQNRNWLYFIFFFCWKLELYIQQSKNLSLPLEAETD